MNITEGSYSDIIQAIQETAYRHKSCYMLEHATKSGLLLLSRLTWCANELLATYSHDGTSKKKYMQCKMHGTLTLCPRESKNAHSKEQCALKAH